MSTRQLELLRKARSFSFDATHNVSTITNAQLYTIIVVNPRTGRGFPAAFFFFADNTVQPASNWLQYLKEKANGLPDLRQITVDGSIVEVGAIEQVFPGLPIHWCAWHFQRAWNTNIKKHVK